MEHRNVIIIGSGPSGLTAALYNARADLKPLVIEGQEPGGQLTLTTDVENYPGFPESIQGPQLIEKMKTQAKKFGAEFLNKFVKKVILNESPFKILCDDGSEFLAESIILSTGASPRLLGLDNEKQLIGRGISTCATCDGFFYKNKIVHVVGGGDTAMEEAIFLTKFADKVYIIHRRDKLKASKVMQTKALNHPKIEVIWDSAINKINFDQNGVTGIDVINLKTNQIHQRQTHGIFYGIGHIPNTAFLDNQVKLDQHGFIVTENGPFTSREGVFACGDVQDPVYRQAITSAGTGCMAAMCAEKYLEGKISK